VCTYTGSLSLSHIDLLRLTCWLASIVSGKNKPGIEKKKRGKKTKEWHFPDVTGRRKTKTAVATRSLYFTQTRQDTLSE